MPKIKINKKISIFSIQDCDLFTTLSTIYPPILPSLAAAAAAATYTEIIAHSRLDDDDDDDDEVWSYVRSFVRSNPERVRRALRVPSLLGGNEWTIP